VIGPFLVVTKRLSTSVPFTVERRSPIPKSGIIMALLGPFRTLGIEHHARSG
jgi:hypothetical protein